LTRNGCRGYRVFRIIGVTLDEGDPYHRVTIARSMMPKMRIVFLYFVLLFLGSAPLSAAGNYFRVAEQSGVWWFVTPSGQRMLSIGVDNVSYRGDVIHGTTIHPYFDHVSKLYANKGAWAIAELTRLRSWRFNTIGAWSDPGMWDRGMPYTVILDIAARSGGNWLKGIPADYYSSRFEKTARRIAQSECALRAHDPDLLGYFSDNELRWGPDWRGKQNMLAMYLSLPARAPGRHHAIEFLKKKYSGSIQSLDRAWGIHVTRFGEIPSQSGSEAYRADNSEFLGMVARRYFQVCARAIHEADPNHLYLGAKFAGLPPAPVLQASHLADVVSVDIYKFDPRPMVMRIFEAAHRPVLVAEFAFRAENSGLPNTQGAGPKVADDAARARAYKNYVTSLEDLPEAIGFHWFEWCDEPKQGRFDGENSNYGLVNIQDQPYRQFVTAVKAANREAISIHQALMRKAYPQAR
jgi:hypothetical protein